MRLETRFRIFARGRHVSGWGHLGWLTSGCRITWEASVDSSAASLRTMLRLFRGTRLQQSVVARLGDLRPEVAGGVSAEDPQGGREEGQLIQSQS